MENTTLDELYPALPGTGDVPPPPRELFEKMLRRRGEGYRPRTRHLHGDGRARYTNRLFLESSPYLLQHAHNPVNWFPWGEEAFRLAARLDRPVLVSIGYATCHWCHVMEEESFEDEKIAEFLNANFVAVKVDREERPDVDSVYMSALHAMGMQGGWPLNVFLTPGRKPFYGGTYFPPYDHPRGPGFLSLLRQLSQVYQKEPERVAQAGLQLTEAVQGMLAPAPKEAAAQEASLHLALRAYQEHFDPRHGGLQGAPKFPSSLPLRLLLRQYRVSGEQRVLDMVEKTLTEMAAAGIYDQIGGGFHRYATDEKWMIPHFEKMLYDNALLAVSYLEGSQASGNRDHAAVAREILLYLQREMTAPQGGFYSATDADSLTSGGKREEGVFFAWTPEEIFEILGAERGKLAALYFGIESPGNFEGRSVPHRRKSLKELAGELKLTEETLRATLEEARGLLYEARSRRPLPLRDEKILASWNGLAISAFARGGLVLREASFTEQARRAAGFMLEEMAAAGRLAHSYQEGEAKGEGFLDDYAFFIAALIDLFEVTGEVRWLKQALDFAAVVEEEFADRENGGYFMTGSRHEPLIAREKPAYDGVVPSGNSVMIMNLLRLEALTEEAHFLEQGRRALDSFAAQLSAAPTALSEMLMALDYLRDIPRQVMIVAPEGKREAAEGVLRKLAGVYLPNRALAVVCEGEELEQAEQLVPSLRGKRAEGDRAVGYLCENRSCRLPTSDPEEFGKQLEESGRRR
jgi:uncharacterized protein